MTELENLIKKIDELKNEIERLKIIEEKYLELINDLRFYDIEVPFYN